MRLRSLVEPTISAIEYVLVVVFAIGGINTLFLNGLDTGEEIQDALGSHIAFIVYGVIYLCTAVFLLYAKVGRKQRTHSTALMIVFMVSLFSFILELQVFKTSAEDWADTCTLTIITGLLYLRCRYHYFKNRKG